MIPRGSIASVGNKWTVARLVSERQKAKRPPGVGGLFAMILYGQPTPDQHAELDDAKRLHRPILIIRGQRVDFGQSGEIIPAQDDDEKHAGAFIYDAVLMRESR